VPLASRVEAVSAAVSSAGREAAVRRALDQSGRLNVPVIFGLQRAMQFLQARWCRWFPPCIAAVAARSADGRVGRHAGTPPQPGRIRPAAGAGCWPCRWRGWCPIGYRVSGACGCGGPLGHGQGQGLDHLADGQFGGIRRERWPPHRSHRHRPSAMSRTVPVTCSGWARRRWPAAVKWLSKLAMRPWIEQSVPFWGVGARAGTTLRAPGLPRLKIRGLMKATA